MNKTENSVEDRYNFYWKKTSQVAWPFTHNIDIPFPQDLNVQEKATATLSKVVKYAIVGQIIFIIFKMLQADENQVFPKVPEDT